MALGQCRGGCHVLKIWNPQRCHPWSPSLLLQVGACPALMALWPQCPRPLPLLWHFRAHGTKASPRVRGFLCLQVGSACRGCTTSYTSAWRAVYLPFSSWSSQSKIPVAFLKFLVWKLFLLFQVQSSMSLDEMIWIQDKYLSRIDVQGQKLIDKLFISLQNNLVSSKYHCFWIFAMILLVCACTRKPIFLIRVLEEVPSNTLHLSATSRIFWDKNVYVLYK